MEEDKDEELKREIDESEKARLDLEERVLEMTSLIEDLEHKNDKNMENNRLLEDLFKEGVIDKEGNINPGLR